MNRKIYRAVVIVLVVLTIGQIIRFGFQLYGDQYHYHYDEDTFLYSIQDGQYSELPEKKNRNEMEHVKADAQCWNVMQWLITMRQHLCIMLMKISEMQQKRQLQRQIWKKLKGAWGT